MTKITDPNFMYIKAAFTDITKVWRKYGWTPPDRSKQDKMRLALNRLN